MHFESLACLVPLGVLLACSSDGSLPSDSDSGGRSVQAGSGGIPAQGGGISGGSASGGKAPGNGGRDTALGGATTGGAAVAGSGAGGTTTGGVATGGAATGGAAGAANGGVGGAVPSGGSSGAIACASGGNAGASSCGGAGAQTVCGTAGLICPSGEICVANTLYPNNIDPNNVMPPNTHWACVANPCGTAPLSCECARSACSYPECNVPSSTKLECVYHATCASPATRIATPTGERAIAELSPGDLVYSADGQSLRPVPILRVAKTAVHHHRVVEVRTADGSVLEISSGHPTADGRWFGELRAGDRLDGELVVSARLVEYDYSHTYDILPASDTGTYVAFGKLIGSTLK